MTTNSSTSPAQKPSATLRALVKFERVRLSCDGLDIECSTKSAIFELKRTGRTLADVQVVDYDNRNPDAPRSRQCQAMVDALLASSLPDPAFNAANSRQA